MISTRNLLGALRFQHTRLVITFKIFVLVYNCFKAIQAKPAAKKLADTPSASLLSALRAECPASYFLNLAGTVQVLVPLIKNSSALCFEYWTS